MSSLEDRLIKVEDQLRALQMRQAAATAHPNTPPIPSPPAMRVIELESQVCEGENSVNDVMSPSSSTGIEATIITYENDLSTVTTPTNSTQLNNADDDKLDTSGKNIANKLSTLSPEIAIVTEKLSCDVLFEAQIGNISRYTKVILQDSRSQYQHIQSSQSQHFDSTSTRRGDTNG
ncbi:unnamed protein product [Psylliodes chrysocephalus]|uniref:Uncharacterized protein n=1 Tax=Psylliodes chrysocephalus TaxID=3402493 RepID=A0A9P0CRV8_9CUCU|nr:unnamed protein product [Psylliodes chrysocephala]